MDVQLTAAHWVYLVGILVILATMALRKNIVVPAVIATFLTALVFSGSIVTGLSAIFNASLVAAKELFNIFLIIAMVTAMLGALRQLGADRMMVAPFRRVMRAGTSSFLVLAAVTYVISLFFWPTPAVPLVGAVLIPVAIRAACLRCRWAWSSRSAAREWRCRRTTSSRSHRASPRPRRGSTPMRWRTKHSCCRSSSVAPPLCSRTSCRRRPGVRRLPSCSSNGKPRPIGGSANHVPGVMILRVGVEDRSRCRRVRPAGPPVAVRRNRGDRCTRPRGEPVPG